MKKFSFKYCLTFFATTAVLCCISYSHTSAQGDRNYVSFSTAVFDILQKKNTALEGRVEVRLNKFEWLVKPFTGVMGNTDGAVHVFAGLFIEIPVTSFLYVTPSLAPGLYHASNSKDLDFLLQFRSQLEIILKLDDGLKVGVSFNHISNASLGTTNPGVESLALSYYFPL